MIGHLKGTITWLGENAAIIDVQGVGYRVLIGKNTRATLQIGQPGFLFTHLCVKESEIELIGFATENEYILFTILIQASGIGARLALATLDSLGVSGAARAIAQKDAAMLGRVPGIGKKTAERIGIELSDKIPQLFIEGGHSPVIHDIIDALVAMGYSEYHAQKAAHGLTDITSLETGLARALQALSK